MVSSIPLLLSLLGNLWFQAVWFCRGEQGEFLTGETPFFLCQDSVGEPLYMLFRGIKHQVDKGPVDWVTGKAKYTLNDNRLLREDLEYRTLVSTKSIVPCGPSGVTRLSLSPHQGRSTVFCHCLLAARFLPAA